VLLYYITDRKSFAGTEMEQRNAVLRRIADAARAGVDYIQLREKDLSPRELERLAREALSVVHGNSDRTKLLINGRADIALACGADGVHLPSDEIRPSEVRTLWMKCSSCQPAIGVSAHSAEDVRYAHAHGADFAVLAPIFEKIETAQRGIGLEALRECCASSIAPAYAEQPHLAKFTVLALGGVTLSNARACLEAGASGVAGIRLFQTGEVKEAVRRLRERNRESLIANR
jgi:thiamine-phosphate pyrophosphorylase